MSTSRNIIDFVQTKARKCPSSILVDGTKAPISKSGRTVENITIAPKESSNPLPPSIQSNSVEATLSAFGSLDRENAPSAPMSSASDLNTCTPSQPLLKKYPAPSVAGSVARSFNSNWYKGRPWLEYSTERDAAFCFPCRVFGVNQSSTTFTEEGFNDWKHALDGWNLIGTLHKCPKNRRKLKGFAKHAASTCHANSFSAWQDKEARDAASFTLGSIAHKSDNENRKWLEVIFHIIRYLAAEGLPVRGDDENLDFSEGLSGGLCLDTIINLVFPLQPEIAALAKKIPRNAKYLSSDIQNEIIQVMANMVRNVHASRVKNSEIFTIMVDGTSDTNREEIQGVVARFLSLKTGEIEEKALNVGESGRSAKGIFAFVRDPLEDCGNSFDGLCITSF